MPRAKKEEIKENEVMDGQVTLDGEVVTKEVAIEEEVKEEKELTETQKLVRFYKKKELLRKKLLAHKFVVDGYNDNQRYEYVKAEQFRNALSKYCLEVGLDYHLDGVNCIFENIIKSDKMYLTTVIQNVHLIDIETGYEQVSRVFAQGSDNLDKGMYKADTMILKEYVRNEFGVIDKDESADCEATLNIKEEKPKFIAPEKKEEIAKQVVATQNAEVATPKTEEPKVETTVVTGELTTPEFIKNMISIMDEVRKVLNGWGQPTYDKLQKALETNEMPPQLEMVSKLQAIEKKYNEVCGG